MQHDPPRRPGQLGLLVALFGCGAAPAPASAPAAPAALPAPPSSVAPADAPELALPAAACVVRGRGLPASRQELRLAADGPAFAIVRPVLGFGSLLAPGAPGGPVELHIPAGPAGALGLRVESDELDIRGLVDAADIQLHARAPVVLGGFLVLRGGLRLIGVDADAIAVEPRLGPGIEVLGEPPRPTLRCDELALHEAADVDPDLLPRAPREEFALLRAGSPIALAVDIAGETVARLHPTTDMNRAVSVVETRGKRARVVWDHGAASVFGWIAAASLEPLVRQRGVDGEMAAPWRPEPALARLRCDRRVPLLAELDGQRRTVGAVLPGVVIEVIARSDGRARIAAPTTAPTAPTLGGPTTPDIIPARRAAFLVRDADLDGCAPQPRVDDGANAPSEGMFAMP